MGVGGFNPPVMHRHSALSCFVARAISSVPPAVAGNSGPGGGGGGGGSDYLWTLKTWVSADSIRRVIRGHSVGFRFVPPALLGNSPRGGGGLFVDFGNLVAHGRVGRSWPGIDFTPGFCLRPSPPVLLFLQGPQALPMLRRKAGRGAFNTMDV